MDDEHVVLLHVLVADAERDAEDSAADARHARGQLEFELARIKETARSLIQSASANY